MTSDPKLDSFVGDPIADRSTGARMIPLVRRIVGPTGESVGFAAGLLRAADFETLYQTVSLGRTGAISLVSRDGQVLARYPQPSGSGEAAPANVGFTAAIGDELTHRIRSAN